MIAAENGFTDEEVAVLTAELREKGLVNFLRDYLLPATGAGQSLRKLLLGLGVIPVGLDQIKLIGSLRICAHPLHRIFSFFHLLKSCSLAFFGVDQNYQPTIPWTMR